MENSKRNTDYDHDKLAEAVEAYSQLPQVQEDPNLIEDIQWKVDLWRENIYKLVTVGEIKKGKSSFVNALLGSTDLAPVAARVASSVPIKIIYGERPKFRVHFLLNDPDNPGQKVDPIEIKPEELEQYATETGTGEFKFKTESGNRNNQLGVDFISIEYPNDYLKEGLAVIDLPGLGGVFKHHTRLVQEYLHPKRADHIVYVLDSTGNPLSKEERAAIQMLKEKKMDRFLFVQTKIDAPSSEVVEKYKQENLRQISEVLEKPAEEIKYFTVSNKLKLDYLKTKDDDDLQESNFPILEKYLLNELIPGKRDWLADSFTIDLDARLTEMETALLEERAIYQADSAGERQALEIEAKKNHAEFIRWRSTELPKIREQLRGALVKAQRSSFRELRRSLDFSELAEGELSELEQSQPTVEQVKEAASHIFNNVQDQALSAAQSIMDDYEMSCQLALDEASEQLEESIPMTKLGIGVAVAGGVSLREISVQDKVSDRRSKVIGSAFLGSSAGGIAATVGAKLLAFTIPVLSIPMLVVSAVSLISGFLFGKKANHDYKLAQGEKALSILRRNITNSFGKLKNEIQLHAEENYEEVNAEILHRFDSAVDQKLKRLDANVQACKEAAQAKQNEIKQTLDKLNSRVRAVGAVHKSLRDSMDW